MSGPDKAPISEDRKQELRRIMGPDVWDTLEPHMPEVFMEAYDKAVEVLYGGDVTGVEEAKVAPGKLTSSGWPFKDTRVISLKVWADAWCSEAAEAIRQAQGQAGHTGPQGPTEAG